MKKVNIYTIEDTNGEIRYIGETIEPVIKRSYKHIYCAKNPNKRNAPVHKWIYSLLQKGEIPIFKKLDECDFEIWESVEKMYISLFKTWGFNLLNIQEGGRVKITKEMKISGNIRSASSHKIKILQLDDNLNKLNSFNSIKEAAKFLNLKSSSSISNVLKGRCPKASGFYWCYEKDFPNNLNIKTKILKSDLFGIKIAKYNDSQELVQVYHCIRDVLKEFLKSPKSNSNGLKNAIKNNSKWKGFYWKFTK